MNEKLTREVTSQDIVYKNEKGYIVKWIKFDGSVAYDDVDDSRVDIRTGRRLVIVGLYYNRADGGPSVIESDGDRSWYNRGAKGCLYRSPRVGNNRKAEGDDYIFFRAKYGIYRIVYYGNIEYRLHTLHGTEQSWIRIKNILRSGTIYYYDLNERKGGPNSVYLGGAREWDYSLLYHGAMEGRNPKKTWGNKDYIMERYDYSKEANDE